MTFNHKTLGYGRADFAAARLNSRLSRGSLSATRADSAQTAITLGASGDAALSLLGDTMTSPVVIELLDVAMDGNTLDYLDYKVRILDGKLPANLGAVGLFIDPSVWLPPRRPLWLRPWIRCRWSYYYVHRVCHRAW